MLFFGHLGIGSKLVAPMTRGLPRKWILLGAVLPDLIDKPLYYSLVAATGKWGADVGLISGTRTIGHSGLFLIAVAALAIHRRSKVLAALAAGIASHIFLDCFVEQLKLGSHFDGHFLLEITPHSSLRAVFYPLLGWRFPIAPFHSLKEQLTGSFEPELLWSEVFGAALLFWDNWKLKHKKR